MSRLQAIVATGVGFALVLYLLGGRFDATAHADDPDCGPGCKSLQCISTPQIWAVFMVPCPRIRRVLPANTKTEDGGEFYTQHMQVSASDVCSPSGAMNSEASGCPADPQGPWREEVTQCFDNCLTQT
jgi:hypothetical protein